MDVAMPMPDSDGDVSDKTWRSARKQDFAVAVAVAGIQLVC